MKVLITGANGFLGSWMARHLKKSGLDIRILCRPTSDLSELNGINFETVHGDVTDLSSVEKAVDGVDSVFHFAGLVAYTKKQRAAMEAVNVDGTRNVVTACEKRRVRRLLHVSSVMAIGASFDGKQPLNEDSDFNLHPWNLGYAETKLAGEIIVREAVKNGRIDAVIVNPGTVYGPGDAKKGTRNTQVKVAQGKFPFYTSGGVNISHVNDAVAAFETAWKSGRSGERYIVGGENVTIKQAFFWIAEAAQVDPPKIYLSNPVVFALGKLGDALENFGTKGPINSENARNATLFHWFDNAKAKRELALKVTPAKDCIFSSVTWMKENGLLK